MAARAEIVTRHVLDSSAVLAMLLLEPGGDLVAGVIGHAIMSAVNYAEAIQVLNRNGMTLSNAIRSLRIFRMPIEPYDEQSALATAALLGPTTQLGLSFGDRACVALAQRLHLPVMTADRAWGKLNIGVEIKLIRG